MRVQFSVSRGFQVLAGCVACSLSTAYAQQAPLGIDAVTLTQPALCI